MKNIVEIEGLQKIYDMGEIKVHALRRVDLTIAEGEFTAIMGASGSGKSTLLNVLGCLDASTAGTYRLDGQQVNQNEEEELARHRRTKLGFVFQNFNLLNSSTSLENVELPMVYLGIPRRERHQRAMAALERVGLAERVGHMPWQLSGGQQQRVALARALVTRPRLLLADEPTGNLDSHTSEEVLGLLAELHRDDQLTVLLVTHDPDIAACTRRVVILHDGRIVYDKPGPNHGGPPIPHIRELAASLSAEQVPQADPTGQPTAQGGPAS